MDKETLMKFCGDESSYVVMLTQPFSIGDFTYATDGKILVKIPRVEGIGENERAPRVDKVEAATPKEWHKVDEDIQPPKPVKCDVCDGLGRDFDCPECGGAGIVYLSNSYNSYKVECDFCGGNGEIDFCEECDGTGKYTPIKKMEFHGTYFDARYLALMSELPECELGVNPVPGCSPFRFKGGTGLLMPMRPV